MGKRGSEALERYETMLRVRATEMAISDLWRRGLVSGEMHSCIGEEGIVAGVSSHLATADAVACDHRPTGVFVARGVSVEALLLEMLGHENGLNRGRAGHMHLMDESRLLVSDGIVGSSGPGACGFAFAAEHLRPGSIAVAFFGEGALNQGMLIESFNLAQVWRLPVLFVCKDNRWSITTRSREVTAGSPVARARAFGLRADCVRGSDVEAVARTAGRLIERVRRRRQPAYLHARCMRPDGHFLGDPMLRLLDDPVGQYRDVGLPLMATARRGGGASGRARVRATLGLTRRLGAAAAAASRKRHWDPIARARRRLDDEHAAAVERRVVAEVAEAVEAALTQAGLRS